MDIEKAWEKALKNTEIIRSRMQALQTFRETRVPYILLSESSINVGDTVVRKGEVVVERPALILPPNNPQFLGFEFNQEEQIAEESLINYLLVRGISLPSFRYDNQISFLDIYEGKLSQAIKHYQETLQHQENVSTGLLVCPQDCWPLSLLIFICTQIARDANQDIRRLLANYKNPSQ